METAQTNLTFSDIRDALTQGWRDFARAPVYGIVFSAFYVIVGIALYLVGAGTFTWTLVLSLGFPLVAPFAAVGLYEVSRRIHAGEPLTWRGVLGVVWDQRGAQTPWIGVILLIIFLFWSFFAHMSLAIFLGNMTLTNVLSSWEVYMTPNGIAMIVFQVIVGGLVALLTFAMTVISLPMLLDREIDFVTAMLKSLAVFRRHLTVLIIWAAIIAVLLFIAYLPLYLGLLVVLPILGHATWHLYTKLRDTV